MRKEIKTLTGVRGVAALLVAVYHFSVTTSSGLTSLFSIPRAYMCVDAFFILSGFVLSYTYADMFARSLRSRDYIGFLYKRFCRLYPAYFFILCLTLPKMFMPAADGSARDFTPLDVVSNFLMLNTWAINAKLLITPSWSVCVEIFCYLIFPAIVIISTRGARLATFAILVAYLGIVAITRTHLGVEGQLDVVTGDTFYPTLRALCGFMIGMGFNRLMTTAASKRVNWDLICCIGLSGLIASIYASASDAIVYVAIAAIVVSASAEGVVSRAVFANPLSYFLGKISYSLYLVHAMFVAIFAKLAMVLSGHISYELAYFSMLAAYIVTVIVFSMASYTLFEVKIQAILRGLWPGPKRSTQPA